jgi:hypothetical protein
MALQNNKQRKIVLLTHLKEHQLQPGRWLVSVGLCHTYAKPEINNYAWKCLENFLRWTTDAGKITHC